MPVTTLSDIGCLLPTQSTVKPEQPPQGSSPTRRNFIKNGSMMLASGAIGGSNLSVAQSAHVIGSDMIKIGLIGCGGRGTGAVIQALNTGGGGVKLVAMADAFKSNLQKSYRTINGLHPEKVDCDDGRQEGLDAYKSVMESEANVVFLATPPGFRPQHFEAAVNAGKHVFMEKPVATDSPGVRRVLEANQLAKKKGLAVHVGLQRRHEVQYQQCIEKIHQGAIGDLIFARAYWNGGGVWVRPRQSNQTELGYQLRNWYYFTWLGGDHIDEQHIHNLDVINWVAQSYPIEAQGVGGREVRTGPDHGQIFDHHMIEYTYKNGLKLLSQCRHIQGCWNSISEHVHGTSGVADISRSIIRDREGRKQWESDSKETRGKGCQQEQNALFAALRAGNLPNEGDYGAYSTMTAIMGRMATYSGKRVKWNDAINSETRLAETDVLESLEDSAPIQPNADGRYSIAVPGNKSTIA